MERDYFLDAEQALELGLVDKVLTSREEQEQLMGPLKGDKEDKDKDGEGVDDGKSGGSRDVPPSPAANPSSS